MTTEDDAYERRHDLMERLDKYARDNGNSEVGRLCEAAKKALETISDQIAFSEPFDPQLPNILLSATRLDDGTTFFDMCGSEALPEPHESFDPEVVADLAAVLIENIWELVQEYDYELEDEDGKRLVRNLIREHWRQHNCDAPDQFCCMACGGTETKHDYFCVRCGLTRRQECVVSPA